MSQSPLYAPRPTTTPHPSTHSYAPQRQNPVPEQQLARGQAPRRRRSRRSSQTFGWLISGIALTTLAIVPQEQLSRWLAPLAAPHAQQQSVPTMPLGQSRTEDTCQTILNNDQRLSREQLTQFLSLAQGTAQNMVHGTIAPPYCALSKSQQPKQQEAYPLAFDPDTWFVVNYDQGNYAGYDFVFKK